MNTEFDEKQINNSDAPESEENYAFQKVMPAKNKENRRTWSVASLVLSVLSILLVYFSWAGVVCGVLAIGCAFISRKNIGYFDKLSLAGMFIGIFGVVFSVGAIIFSELLLSVIA